MKRGKGKENDKKRIYERGTFKGRNFRGKKFSWNLISRIEGKISRVSRKFDFEPKSKIFRNFVWVEVMIFFINIASKSF